MFYSVCLNALFAGKPAQEAIALVREAGYDACEIWGWWDMDVDAVREALKRHQVRMTAMCTRFVPLNAPERRQEYLDGLAETLGTAKKLGVKTVITQVGQELVDVPRAQQGKSIIDGLKACVPLLEEAGAVLVIEPLNTRYDHPGYFLSRADEAFAIVRAVGSPHVKVLFDVYHQQITEGNLIPNLWGNVGLVGHVHIAGHPGRHEPYGDNEICYPAVLRALEADGYTGAVGLEYFPLGDAKESLKKLTEEIPL